MNYTKLDKMIKKMVKLEMLKPEHKRHLRQLVINEYVDCGDNPNDAKLQDLCEIADASSLAPVCVEEGE